LTIRTVAIVSLLAAQVAVAEPDWSTGAALPASGNRANVFELSDTALAHSTRAGRLHAVWYPVSVTGLLLPYRPIARTLGGRGLDEVYDWMGWTPYAATDAEIPWPTPERPAFRMGASLIGRTYDTGTAVGLSAGCAGCHVASLFGRPVFGLSTRFPRGNLAFERMKQTLWAIPGLLMTAPERAMLLEAKSALQLIGPKEPQVLGLDTALAHTALSLARRTGDASNETLAHHVADSKPSVWWNVKYKTRWLSDGSVLSGNPVHTNLLWNEIGRATDLDALGGWLRENDETVRNITAAVFASEPPRYTDFFPAAMLDPGATRRGGEHYDRLCARCHGAYENGRLHYHARTPVIDVGTDPGRWQGMATLAPRLNQLALSSELGILVAPQRGYVPPPLAGIWARWPYFHNNAAPTLCAVLTRGPDRPTVYYARDAVDPSRDFDAACNGYPAAIIGLPAMRFDTRREGLSNRGHDEGIFLDGGRELLTPADKRDLITFLKTL